MSPAEVAWRLGAALRDLADRGLLPLRQRGLGLGAISTNGEAESGPRYAPSGRVWPEGGGNIGEALAARRERLVAQADAIADGRLSFFDLDDCRVGLPVNWNCDHKHGVAAPMGFAPGIDYRDFAATGDCKFVWEPSRHHQMVVLGRAYRVTGDVRYARAAVEQIATWLDQCPYGVGMQWRSPLELGIRLINWTWTVDLIRDSGLVTGDFRTRLLGSIHRHAWEIDRKYSRGSSVNNHLVGEAAGVFVAASCFRHLRGADRWRARSRRILEREILRQTYADGCTREQALGYHMFVLQFFTIAGLAARWGGEDFSPAYWQRLEKMYGFLGALAEGGLRLPVFGDADDGYVLDLGGADPRDARAWLAVGAVLFGRSDFKAWAGGLSEPAFWLLGPDAQKAFDAIEPAGEESAMQSRAFADSGHYLLQSAAGPAPVSVLFDCGNLGMGPLAAHGHADALAFTLRLGGRDVLVDPGMYDYFTYPEWRRYFRGTRAHNTVAIDGQDQSEMLGPFLWGRKARARLLEWSPTPAGGVVAGEHDGYAHGPAPVVHRRRLDVNAANGILRVEDTLESGGSHDVEAFFHLAEDCDVRRMGPHCFFVRTGDVQVALELDPQLAVEAIRGGTDPIAGWVSRGYHRKAAATTLIGRMRAEGRSILRHVITIVGGRGPE
jgi:hypothetical protein